MELALLDWGGDGPLALLHHANGFCAATLDLVAQQLRPRFHVIGVDGRGHGDSSRPVGESAYAWGEFGSDLAAVARALAAEVGGRVALGVGHSFGGTAMVLAASAEPRLFERLVLIDPPVFEPGSEHLFDDERRARASALVERASRRRSVFPDRAAARESWRDKHLFAAWDPRAFEIYLAEGLADRDDGQVELKCTTETEAAVFGQGRTSGVWHAARGLAVPTLILWARRGDFPRAIYESFAALFRDGRVEDLDAGHLAPMEDPDLVAKAVLAFAGPPARA